MSLCILFTVAASERVENRISCWKTSVELNKLRNRTMATTFHLWWTKFFGIFFNKLPEHFAVLMLFWCFGSNDKSCLTTYWPTQLHKTISTNNKITCFWRKKNRNVNSVLLRKARMTSLFMKFHICVQFEWLKHTGLCRRRPYRAYIHTHMQIRHILRVYAYLTTPALVFTCNRCCSAFACGYANWSRRAQNVQRQVIIDLFMYLLLQTRGNTSLSANNLTQPKQRKIVCIRSSK